MGVTVAGLIQDQGVGYTISAEAFTNCPSPSTNWKGRYFAYTLDPFEK
jgi:hypothetical protein